MPQRFVVYRSFGYTCLRFVLFFAKISPASELILRLVGHPILAFQASFVSSLLIGLARFAAGVKFSPRVPFASSR